MWKRALGCAVLLVVLVPTALEAQNGFLRRLNGRVRADGRPVDWLIELRLDSVSGGTVATAYTLSGDEFEFRNIAVNTNESYFITINEPGFRSYRQEVRFGRDPFGRVFTYNGMFVIDLERNPPPEDEAVESETLAVDLRQLMAEIPEEASAAYEHALEQLDNGDREAGIDLLEEALALAPDYYEVLNRLGIEYFTDRRFREAEELIGHAAELNRNDPVPLTNLGVLHFQEGIELESAQASDQALAAFEKSVEAFEDTLRLNPVSATVAYYLGTALFKTGNNERAEILLLEAVERDSALSDARVSLINLYLKQERYEAAITEIDRFLESNPETPRREEMEGIREALESRVQTP